jgi:hypothetical protein
MIPVDAVKGAMLPMGLLALAAGAGAPSMALDSLGLAGCGRIFLDGGSNDGDSVRAFLKGQFAGCALNGPYRLYPNAWKRLSRRERRDRMAPLREPTSFCIRSFEANPAFRVPLHNEEVRLQQEVGADVRFVDAALSNVTSASSPRTVVTYARNLWGSTATTLPFEQIFPKGKPPALDTHEYVGRSWALLDVLEHAVALNKSSVIALKLDVEGAEE